MKSYCTTPKITIYFPNTFGLNFKMTFPPQKRLKSCCCHKKKEQICNQSKYENISNLINDLLPLCLSHFHVPPLPRWGGGGGGGLWPRTFYKPCSIFRSKIILSNPHLLVITGSRIKLIGHFSFCNKFAIYTCHESVCIFLKREGSP